MTHKGLLKTVSRDCEPIRVSHHSGSEGTAATVELVYISRTTSSGTPGASGGAHTLPVNPRLRSRALRPSGVHRAAVAGGTHLCEH